MLTALEITLLLLAASIVAVLALRALGMPALVAYLLVGVVLGMFLWNDGLQRIGSVNAMLLLNLMPIVTFAIRALEGARFEAAELVGAAIVVGSLMANNLMLRRGRRAG